MTRHAGTELTKEAYQRILRAHVAVGLRPVEVGPRAASQLMAQLRDQRDPGGLRVTDRELRIRCLGAVTGDKGPVRS